jgi:DNA-binding NarL/FixJ family response regulator
MSADAPAFGQYARASARVLIVDDHATFRGFARRLLESAGYVVVGEAADGASGLRAARALRPDIVLLDVLLPDTSGFAVADALAAEPAPPLVLLISSRAATDLGSRLETTRAHGFIAKSELSPATLAAALAATPDR